MSTAARRRRKLRHPGRHLSVSSAQLIKAVIRGGYCKQKQELSNEVDKRDFLLIVKHWFVENHSESHIHMDSWDPPRFFAKKHAKLYYTKAADCNENFSPLVFNNFALFLKIA